MQNRQGNSAKAREEYASRYSVLEPEKVEASQDEKSLAVKAFRAALASADFGTAKDLMRDADKMALKIIEEENSDKRRPLHEAIYESNLPAVLFLVENGARVKYHHILGAKIKKFPKEIVEMLKDKQRELYNPFYRLFNKFRGKPLQQPPQQSSQVQPLQWLGASSQAPIFMSSAPQRATTAGLTATEENLRASNYSPHASSVAVSRTTTPQYGAGVFNTLNEERLANKHQVPTNLPGSVVANSEAAVDGVAESERQTLLGNKPKKSFFGRKQASDISRV